jgi:hypothetical protein
LFKQIFIFNFLLCLNLSAQLLDRNVPFFYSTHAKEYTVQFQGLHLTSFKNLNEVAALSSEQRQYFISSKIHPTLRYIFGPMTNRALGGVQRGLQVAVNWEAAQTRQGQIYVPYIYNATWLIGPRFLQNSQNIPVPYSAALLNTPQWANCADSSHGDPQFSMLWYYWDPERLGCDHKENQHFQIVNVKLLSQTEMQKNTAPEYERMFRRTSQNSADYKLTFAFGYVEEPPQTNPDTDKDLGAYEYQKFLRFMREKTGNVFQEQPIFQREYGARSPNDSKVMGHRFVSQRGNVRILINVVMSGDVDQMDIFSKSFAQDHESFFGWFGHSRVGLGFDSDHLIRKLRTEPQKYSITNKYQLVYWAGCNSYSYYTVPFFDLKKSLQDPNGTKNLDIVSNGLPSYFALNSINAQVMTKHLLAWQSRSTYQTIVDDLEFEAHKRGFRNVLINVLGDEDNNLSR